MTISVVVLTYNRRECVRELLEELQQLSHRLAEIIVVDNAGTDGTADLVTSEFPAIVYLRNEKNLGACGRNRGMIAARGDLVVTLDDDVFGLEVPDLELISSIFDEDPSVGALNFRVTDYFSGSVCNWVHHCPSSRALETFPTYEITEGAVAFRNAALREVGYYWEDYFIGHEGPDLAFRLMDAGFEVRYDGRVTLRHKHEGQSRAGWRFYYYDTRNQVWLAARKMRPGLAFRYLSIGLPAMAFYSVRDGFVVWWLRGVFAALKGLRRAWRTRVAMKAETELKVRRIDRDKPSVYARVRKRAFQPANRLDG